MPFEVNDPAGTAAPTEPDPASRGSSVTWRRRVLLILLLLALAALKLAFNPALGRNSLDGDFYYQIARNVLEGQGLQTSVSLYHQGLKTLPHPSNAPPLWPLTMATAARGIGLDAAARVLPEAIYLLALLLLYLLVRRLSDVGGYGVELPAPLERAGLDPGHLAVLLFGLNPIFFHFTSLPYTEALAFTLLFGALLAAGVAAGREGLGWAALAGLLAGLAFVTRVQMLGAAAGICGAFLLAGLRRRRFLALAAVAATAAAAPVVVWMANLATWMEPFRLKAMLGIGAYRETPEVLPFQAAVPTGSLWELALDRIGGLAEAFNAASEHSYVASFGLAAFLVPLALVQLLIDRDRRPRIASRLTARSGVLMVATLLAGLASLAPVHFSHFTFFKEWLFGFRHGLPLILLLLVALVYLLRAGGRKMRWAALALVGISIVTCGVESFGLLNERFRSGMLGPEPELVEWLDSQSPRPAVITTIPQPLSVFSRAGFHWMDCGEAPEQTLSLLEHAGADYVLIYPGEERCRSFAGLLDRLEVVRVFTRGRIEVAVLRLPAAEEAGT